MKKLIALFAVSTVASTSAVAGIALSGSASVSYDDNGIYAHLQLHTMLTISCGWYYWYGTTVTIGMDVDGGGTADGTTNNDVTVTGVDMSTKIGPVTIAADMFDEISAATTTIQVLVVRNFEGTAAQDTGVTSKLRRSNW